MLNGGGGDDAIYGNAGDDTIDGGTGEDTIVGGAGADVVGGGGGDDQFVYASASESNSTDFDTISGLNFNGHDLIDLPTAVTSVATISGGLLDAATFDANLGAAVGASLTSGAAVLFNPNAGSYAGQHFLVIDGDGIAGYTAGADFVIMIDDPTQLNRLSIDDFI